MKFEKQLKILVEKLEVLSTNLEHAQTTREQVGMANRIYDVLGEIEKQVEQHVKLFVFRGIGEQSRDKTFDAAIELHKAEQKNPQPNNPY